MPKALDITGEKYGRLTAVELCHRKNYVAYWKFVCDCGKECVVSLSKARNGHTRSCGCLLREITIARSTKHNMAGTPEYEAWVDAKKRVSSKSNRYKYAEHGIDMQESWKKDFMAFYEYVGPKPSPKHSLGRIDNFKGYEEGNVRWETDEQQARNHSKQVNNKSGVVGVHFYVPKGNKVGVWVAKAVVGGVTHVKRFSIKQLGDELAFFLACEQRDQWMLINEMCFGVRFAETHGLSKEEYDKTKDGVCTM